MNGIFIYNYGDEDRPEGNLEILSWKSSRIYINLLKILIPGTWKYTKNKLVTFSSKCEFWHNRRVDAPGILIYLKESQTVLPMIMVTMQWSHRMETSARMNNEKARIWNPQEGIMRWWFFLPFLSLPRLCIFRF